MPVPACVRHVTRITKGRETGNYRPGVDLALARQVETLREPFVELVLAAHEALGFRGRASGQTVKPGGAFEDRRADCEQITSLESFVH